MIGRTILFVVTFFFVQLPLSLLFITPLHAEGCDKGARNEYQQVMTEEDSDTRISRLLELKERCENFQILYEIGRSYLSINDADRSITWFNRAAARSGITSQNRALAFAARAKAFETLDDLPMAIESLELAENIHRDSERAAYLNDLQMKLSEKGYTKEQISRSFKIDRSFGAVPKIDLPVHFLINSAQLTAAGKRQAASLGEALLDLYGEGFKAGTTKENSHKIILTGHTDASGPADFNKKLSKERAETVKYYLQDTFDISPARIITKGKGWSEPRYPGTSERERRLNRRVEVQLR